MITRVTLLKELKIGGDIMADYVLINGELYHHGIKGMKWGRRRWQNKDGSLTPAGVKRYDVDGAKGRMDAAKAKYKQANAEYNNAYGKAYNKSIAAYSPFKKHREANTRRWEDVYDKAQTANAAGKEYKQAKKEYKAERKNEKREINKLAKELNKNATVGERLLANDATRQLAAKYVVKNNMSVEEAKKKANKVAARNTAIILAAYGGIAVATLYKNR